MSLLESLQFAYQELSDNIDDEEWWQGRIRERINSPFQKRIYPGQSDFQVTDAEWDSLIVLDACRADLFESVFEVGAADSYEVRRSPASCTPEWIESSFCGREFGDTVYVTSNPHVDKLASECFHDIVSVWESEFDTDEGTVHPEAVVEASQKAAEQYPNKRIISHFMQPHFPFVPVEFNLPGWSPDIIQGDKTRERARSPFDALEAGNLTRSAVWDGYRQNLEYVIDDASELAEDLPGRSVITSDHGNMFGERSYPIPIQIFEHPPKLRHKALVEIPWAVFDGGNRPDIRDDGVNSSGEAENEELKDRLRDLGYA